MGGAGSGLAIRHGKRTLYEETKRVDIRYLKRRGWLRPGLSGHLRWTCRGEESGYISFSTTEGLLTLSFKFRRNGGEWEPVEQHIALTSTPCHYGNSRKWFVCPGCERRCAVLCGADKLFLCRICHRLPYSTQIRGYFDSLIAKRDQLESELWGADRRRMWEKTKARKYREYAEVAQAADAYLEKYLNRLS